MDCSRYRDRRQHGFTLIELLVSITILAIMVLCITRITADTSQAATAGYRQAFDDVGARAVLDSIMDDLAQAKPYWGSPTDHTDDIFKREDDPSRGNTYDDSFKTDTLRFVACLGPNPPTTNALGKIVAPDTAECDSLKTVFYEVDDGDKPYWSLRRGEIWGAVTENQIGNTTFPTYPILDYVVEFHVDLYDENGDFIDNTYSISSNPADPRPFPAAILVYLAVIAEEDHKKAARIYETRGAAAMATFIKLNARRYFSRAYCPTRMGNFADMDY
jgi:prepilin-type N-terminal cleavage/methylation domain-containing protein